MRKFIFATLVLILSSLSLSSYAQSMEFPIFHFAAFDKNTGKEVKNLSHIKGRICIKENTMLSPEIGYEPSLWLEVLDQNDNKLYGFWFARSYNSKWDVVDAGRQIFLRNFSKNDSSIYCFGERFEGWWIILKTEFYENGAINEDSPHVRMTITDVDNFRSQLLSIINQASIRNIISAGDLVKVKE